MSKIDEAAGEIKPSKYDRPENYKPPAPKPAKKAAVINDDEDALMNFENKPKRAPPKIGQRPVKKKEAAEDMVIDSGPPKKPAAKPPALSSARPKTAISSTKGPSVPII